MATRKRLSDLLRDEAKKGDAVSEPKTAPGARPRNHTSAKPVPAAESAPIEPASDGTGTAAAEAIATLQAALDAARTNEGVLQRQIDSLKTDLDAQITLVKQIKADLERTEGLKTELEEARRVILQLSELNAQLESKAKAPTPAAQVAPVPTPAPKPAPPPRQEVAAGHDPSQRSQIQLRQVLQHPVLPALPTTTLSNDDIGWVD